jgi:hypothetical protein
VEVELASARFCRTGLPCLAKGRWLMHRRLHDASPRGSENGGGSGGSEFGGRVFGCGCRVGIFLGCWEELGRGEGADWVCRIGRIEGGGYGVGALC